MISLDPIDLARIQFALNISFHILFPTISIGLAWILLFFRVRYTQTRNELWEYAYYFWVKVFALTFALGVVSGVTMSFQFGTNWPGFIERAGNIAGPLLGYEVLTAFFLEATFLAIMLFGKAKVSNRVHLIATAMVVLGTTISAFWILSLNSWMQTPQGHEVIDGVFYPVSWWDIVFNPSFPYRLAHMLNASLLTSAFLIAGISAWRIFNKVDGPATQSVLKTGIVMAAVIGGAAYGLASPQARSWLAAAGDLIDQLQIAGDAVKLIENAARDEQHREATGAACQRTLGHQHAGRLAPFNRPLHAEPRRRREPGHPSHHRAGR